MKFTKRFFCFTMGVLFLFFSACQTSEQPSEPSRINLLIDPDYSTGISVAAPGVPVYTDMEAKGHYAWIGGGTLDYNKTADGSGPIWSLAQHSSAYSLVDPRYKVPVISEDGTFTYADPAKTLVINRERREITLGIKGSLEYSSDDNNDGVRDGVNLLPRKGGEYWVHMLLLSTLYPKITVSELDKLEFEMDMTVNECVDVLTERGTPELFKKNVHAAQVTMYFVVYSNSAADQGQFFWFGVPLFDSRFDSIDAGSMFDKGTSSMMVCPGTAAVFDETVQIGTTYKIRYNMIDDLKKGLEVCQEQGLLLSTRVEDLYTSDFNLGWELPGVYDASITFKDFGVYATKKG